MVDVRLHDINVVTDLDQHDPNSSTPDEPVEYDGTVTGQITSEASISQGDDLSSAGELVVIWWEGWWPTLHIEILKPGGSVATQITGQEGILVYLTVDIIGSVNIVDGFILDWVLDLLNISDAQWQILMGVMFLITGSIIGYVLTKFFMAALLAFMVVDASFNSGVLGVGIGFAILTLVTTWKLSDLVYQQRQQYDAPVIVWLVLMMMAFNTFRRRGSADFREDLKDKASDLFMFAAEMLGYSSGTKIGVLFGRFTYIFLGACIAASALAILSIWNEAGK